MKSLVGGFNRILCWYFISYVKLAENLPMPLLVTVAGLVITEVSEKVMVISEFGSKLMPIIFTGVPTGPEAGLIAMIGFAAKTSL